VAKTQFLFEEFFLPMLPQVEGTHDRVPLTNFSTFGLSIWNSFHLYISSCNPCFLSDHSSGNHRPICLKFWLGNLGERNKNIISHHLAIFEHSNDFEKIKRIFPLDKCKFSKLFLEKWIWRKTRNFGLKSTMEGNKLCKITEKF